MMRGPDMGGGGNRGPHGGDMGGPRGGDMRGPDMRGGDMRGPDLRGGGGGAEARGGDAGGPNMRGGHSADRRNNDRPNRLISSLNHPSANIVLFYSQVSSAPGQA